MKSHSATLFLVPVLLVAGSASLFANEGSVAEHMSLLVLQIGVILFAVRFFGFLVKKIGIPSVLGELLAGVIIGPFALGAIPLPGLPLGLFPVQASTLAVSTELYGFATVASILLLFASGLETDLALFLRYSVAGGIVGLGGVIFSFSLGGIAGMLLLDAPFMDSRCLFLGILSTATSVGITARILSDQKKMDSPEGVTILAAAVFDDVLGIIMLAIVLGFVTAVSGSSSAHGVDPALIGMIAAKAFGIWLGFTALGLVFHKQLARFLKLFRHSYDFSICALGIALLLAGLFEKQGLAMIIGAYVTGLSLSKTDIATVIQERIHGLYEFFVPLFFAVMGMLVNVRELFSVDVILFGLLYTLLSVASKVFGCGLPALGLGFNVKGALRIGAGMVPRGEVALIIAGIGITAGILNDQLFGVVIMMTLLTTLFAPPLLNATLNLKGRGTR
ncbi:MAG TPA: cation:proton antiporter, partial [Treponemataceae bacterium]|nr:cation:proton antiporter [Treponemataceae bacterium]